MVRKCLICDNALKPFTKTDDSKYLRLAHRKCWLEFRPKELRGMDFIFTERNLEDRPKTHILIPNKDIKK
tara:strand:+ start:79 stop:288 length:210 start_codon:yes stop_codon:yes gene_type:complete